MATFNALEKGPCMQIIWDGGYPRPMALSRESRKGRIRHVTRSRYSGSLVKSTRFLLPVVKKTGPSVSLRNSTASSKSRTSMQSGWGVEGRSIRLYSYPRSAQARQTVSVTIFAYGWDESRTSSGSFSRKKAHMSSYVMRLA